VSRPLVVPAAAFALGIALGANGLSFRGPAALALPLALSPPLAPLAFAAAGWVAADRARDRPPAALAPGKAVLTGRVVSAPARAPDRIRFALRTPGGELVDAFTPPAPWPLAAGDAVRLPAELRPPAGPRNPGGRDGRSRLAASGVTLQAIATGPVVRVRSPSPLSWLERGRERLAEAADAWLPPREAGLVVAIGTGDRSGVDADTSASFARSGLAHLLAVSGLHLVVVAFGLERLLRGLLLRVDAVAERTDPRRVAAGLALVASVAYAAATGATPPVVRAALAAGAVFVARLVDREVDGLQLLALAALVLLAWDPGALLDPSFQLSLWGVGGLVLGAGPLRAALPSPRLPPGSLPARAAGALLDGLAATLAASAATAPVLAFHFRQLPLLGVLANVPGVPLGSALTVLATLAGVAAPVSPALAAPFLLLARPLAWALLALSDAAAAPRLAALGVASPPAWAVAAFYALALWGGRARGRRGALAFAAAFAVLLAPGPLRAAAARHRGGLEVVFVSVGHGDAALLRLPDGSAVLVDAGGTAGPGADAGARDVVPLLRDLGVTRLAAVFVSHAHPDHALGLAAVGAAFPVDAAFGNGDLGDGEVREVLAALAPRPLLPGDAWERAGVRIEVLGGDREAFAANDASLVLRAVHGEVSFLLPGDVEAAGEAAAVARGGLAADVVKIPHHGSGTSSTPAFVAAVRPRFAVASVGLGNRYGFPHAEVVERWRAAGAEVLRTDEGAVRFLSDGRRLARLPADAVLDPVATWRERP
jgi:competence protein ComEC